MAIPPLLPALPPPSAPALQVGAVAAALPAALLGGGDGPPLPFSRPKPHHVIMVGFFAFRA
ncbi:hypothetical protein [Telluria beijingensis]|uniref:hypothetical protein n=1 Tax=Telluria beijingensis TaxID=3068633 RepID=UPI002795A936|nr:hypothetical protein [Massilia sp. REN29]